MLGLTLPSTAAKPSAPPKSAPPTPPKAEAVTLPSLTDHAPYAEVIARRDKFRAELAMVEGDRDTARLALSENGEAWGARSNADLEAIALAGGLETSAPEEGKATAASKRRQLEERFANLSHRADVLEKALSIIGEQITGAKRKAQTAMVPEVFRDVYKPVVKAAGVKLLDAVKAMLEVRQLQGHIDNAELLIGPCSGMPLPLFDCEQHIAPGTVIDALQHAGIMSVTEATEQRKRFGIA